MNFTQVCRLTISLLDDISILATGFASGNATQNELHLPRMVVYYVTYCTFLYVLDRLSIPELLVALEISPRWQLRHLQKPTIYHVKILLIVVSI